MFRPRSTKYVRLDNESDDVGEHLLDRQFEMPQRPFPRKEILIGFALLLLGIVFITLGVLIHVERWDNKVPGVQYYLTRSSERFGYLCENFG